MTLRACIFPGQGSQSVGMGKALAEAFPIAKHIFQEVDEALKQNLSQIIFEGPEEALTATSNTQPALMAVSIAVLRVLEEQGGKSLKQLCAYVAGHSLGEYSALTAAGAITLSDSARLLRIRGNAMQEAVPAGKGAMAALIGVEFEVAQEIAKRVTNGGVCQAANDNGGGQVVLSGTTGAIDNAIAIAAEYGVRRAVKLPVSAPFHSSLMEPAAKVMAEALAAVSIEVPVVPLIANVTAEETSDPNEIRDLLVRQVTGTVRWRESVGTLKTKGVTQAIEIGAGKVLAGLVKRIDKDIDALSLQTPEEIEQFLKTL
ncbi:MAG: malonyl CoA-acyl carrier protein transacylase [Rickettsiales bacterium]|nr:malonyl CoA-acyl carrier protein transacylase [Rickettsiales bacterium]